MSQVGFSVNKNKKKIEHKFQMLSLNNALNLEEFKTYDKKTRIRLKLKNIDYFCTLKYDGIASSLEYRNGLLVSASTRGNGYIGENILDNINKIENVPKVISDKNNIFVRGELILLKKDFLKINKDREKEGLDLFSNPRNTVSGVVRSDNFSIPKNSILFLAYEILTEENFNFKFSNQMDHLKALGFDVGRYHKLCKSLKEVEKHYKNILSSREEIQYEIDGVVAKINDINIQNKLGIIGNKPRYSIALKFPPVIRTTVIKDVVFEVGKSGIVTPVALLEPVNIKGVLVSKVTLHNYNEILKKDIHIGDTVEIIRSGDVIPKILRVILEKRKGNVKEIRLPNKCTSCSSNLATKKNSLYCINKECDGIKIRKLLNFVSNLEIEDLGEVHIIDLYNKGIVRTFPDIYKLNKEKLYKLDRMGDTLSNKILYNINNKKVIGLDKFLSSISIKGIGKTNSKEIVKRLKDLNTIMNSPTEEFEKIDGVGKVLSNEIYNFFNHKDNINMIEEMMRLGLKFKNNENAKHSKLAGKRIAITGSFDINRNQIINLLEENGATITNTINNKLDFIIVGKIDNSRKLESSKKYNIKSLTYEELINYINFKLIYNYILYNCTNVKVCTDLYRILSLWQM